MKILRGILLAFFLTSPAFAQQRVSSYERMANFGAVYGTQWTIYLLTQRSAIEEHGSLRNWYTYPFSPHFDNDSFDFNIFQHSLSGASYFLFYRARGYTKVDAFLWSFVSSLAFEFTVETVTERPSWQDIYQTPVYGTLLGLGVEKVSDKLVETNTWWGKTLGTAINPFRLLKKLDPELDGVTWSDGKSAGFYVTRSFD